MADWLGTWAHRIEIPIDYTDGIGASVTWLPIPIIIESGIARSKNSKDVSCIFDELTSDDNRKKIACTKADGTTQLYVEIELWADATEDAVLWISRDGWVIDADMSFFIYYDVTEDDNTDYVADLGSRPEVWDSYFKMVQHMVNDNGNVDDSTSNNNDGTKKGAGEPAEVAGMIGKGQDFDGSDDNITIADAASIDLTSNQTVEFWFNPDDWGTDYPGLFNKSGIGAYGYINIFGIASKTLVMARFNGNAVNCFCTGASFGSQHYFVFRYNGTHIAASIDGVWGTPVAYSTAPTPNNEDIHIGGPYYLDQASRYYGGDIDEARYSAVDRSDAWLEASRHGGLGDLLTFGDKETYLQTISPDAITSAEAFGTPKLQLYILPTGIASLEAFGVPKFQLYLLPSSIVSAEAFGKPWLINSSLSVAADRELVRERLETAVRLLTPLRLIP